MQWPLYGTRLRADSGVAACSGALTTSIGTQPRRQPPVAGSLLAGSGASRLADGPLCFKSARSGQVGFTTPQVKTQPEVRSCSGHRLITRPKSGATCEGQAKKKRSRADRTKVPKTKREMSSKLEGDRASVAVTRKLELERMVLVTMRPRPTGSRQVRQTRSEEISCFRSLGLYVSCLSTVLVIL